ncbi:glycerate kinase [Aspergillus ambiguus]|uniref:glycerate kinase family protein n=1 Tax=Aspergillus ambiguus TaxID=176160 RepID=UPI003CCD8D1E
MNVLVCPSGFKGSIDPPTAANCIEAGILRALPSAKIRKVPLADGGEGFAHSLVAARGGEMRQVTVTGPVGTTISSSYGVIQQGQSKTAVIEIAAAAGLTLVPRDCRNPCVTTTFGVGQLIVSALDEGVQRIIVGCGDSGTSDGGAGMLQALGARFIGRDGSELPHAGGGQSLIALGSIDLSSLHPRLEEVDIEVACNWKNILCGPNGVARVYGPQKGASPKQTEALEAALDIYASACRDILGYDVAKMPGSGASGGLGAGLMLLGATLRPRYDAIMEYFNLEGLFEDCDLVFTAEGGIDYQTPRGKIPAEVAMRAKKYQIPVIVLAGTIGDEAEVNYDVGINAYASILQRPSTLEEAIAEAERLLTESAEGVMRMVVVGRKLARR